jgi:hypothetical protein
MISQEGHMVWMVPARGPGWRETWSIGAGSTKLLIMFSIGYSLINTKTVQSVLQLTRSNEHLAIARDFQKHALRVRSTPKTAQHQLRDGHPGGQQSSQTDRAMPRNLLNSLVPGAGVEPA